MRRIIQEAKGVFADGFDLSKRVEERFGRKCFFLATTRTLPSASPLFVPTAPPLSKEEEGGFASNPYRFLFVGRIEKVKGIDLLLEAMACLKEEALNIHLTVVGKGGMEGWARGFVKERGFMEYVTWMGNVTDRTLTFLYESSDCVVIPSRSESIPVVFSEALRFNKTLIVTDVGDMGMLGRQYEVARVVPPTNVLALKEVMKESVERKDNGIQARNKAKREELKQLFDIKTSVERFLADYQ
jgi:glycosyltransferase involved in cell wall biosynthesis